MIIDLHIHTKTGSDGALPVERVIREAKKRNIGLMAIADHDSLVAQPEAISLTKELGIKYITGVELNVTFQPPQGKTISLDFLGYNFDISNKPFLDKLAMMREHRENRAGIILDKVNAEFEKEGVPPFTDEDIQNIKESVDGSFGRPHIAAYMVKKGVVGSVQEAFDRYLVEFNVPKYPLSLEEASKLVRGADGKLVIAHPNDPNGTSLVSVSRDLATQTRIIEENMIELIDGVEVWHKRNDWATTTHYLDFVKKNKLIASGGSDCHQHPIVMGTVEVPEFVARQFVF
jgi:predicted metal-dependent phosphoesterase TrpH